MTAPRREKSYISLNLTPRPHRVMLAASLLRDDLLAKGHVSFPDLKGALLSRAN